MSAVGADDVARGNAVFALGRRDRQRNGFRALLQADESVAPAQVHPEVAGPLFQQPHQPGLGHAQRVHRVIGHVGEVQRHRREHPPVAGLGRLVVAAEGLIEATHVEQSNHLSDKAVGLRFGARARQRVQHDGPDPGQCQLAGQQQPVGPGAGDDDVNVFVSHGVPSFWTVRVVPR